MEIIQQEDGRQNSGKIESDIHDTKGYPKSSLLRHQPGFGFEWFLTHLIKAFILENCPWMR